MSVGGGGWRREGEGEAERDLQISSRNGFSFPCWLRSDSEIFFFPPPITMTIASLEPVPG